MARQVVVAKPEGVARMLAGALKEVAKIPDEALREICELGAE